MIPFDFVNFGSVMVSGINVGLIGDIPDFDSTVGGAWCKDSNIGCIQWQTDDWISVTSSFVFFAVVGEFFGFFAFADKLSSKRDLGFDSFQDI